MCMCVYVLVYVGTHECVNANVLLGGPSAFISWLFRHRIIFFVPFRVTTEMETSHIKEVTLKEL